MRVRLDLVSPLSEAERKRPKATSHLLLIGQLLLATVDECDVPFMLHWASPTQVGFANCSIALK